MLGQLIVSGIAIGATYALIALAMVIVYKASEVLNFAQGDMAMLSAFVAFMMLDSMQLSFWVAFPWPWPSPLCWGPCWSSASCAGPRTPTCWG